VAVYSMTRWMGLVYAAISFACGGSPTAHTGSSMDDAVVRAPAARLSTVTEANGASPDELVNRGWECRSLSWSGDRIWCSVPNQGFPVVAAPPPTDSRAAFTLRGFENGTFVGTLLLSRADVYRGQQCRSTGEPYEFVASIGYYQCFHPAGGR
jgi:hypothetical protein